ncbi:hypothetical protein NLG97_g8173 [Lecanicillium saksenae]|uniref:Uncharacterized protein n=1 Tax=Lecanicillium saksenae TaxID=468837 RepID=A0ACC1QL17_9HYPO|nr:hypothetical protein NLG97_g8173 [Lecanicillium saksenae]
MKASINYRGLALAKDQIRLIKLHGRPEPPLTASDTDTLECDLRAYSRDRCPPYSALSYAWQHQNRSARMIINGAAYDGAETVEQALRQLRQDEGAVFVWVDQICINQGDNDEKGHQVQQMHRTFSEASTVVAWLGTPFPGSDMLFRFLQQAGAAAHGEQWDTVAELLSRREYLPVRDAFRRFCQRPYWSRLWVIQEFAVCARLRIVCGGSSLDPDNELFALMAAEYPENHEEEYGEEMPIVSAQAEAQTAAVDRIKEVLYPQERSFVASIITRRYRYRPLPESTENACDSFFRVLTTCLVLESDYNWPLASDPRDRVFALVQLASDLEDFDKNKTFVDYSKTTEQVYYETMATFLYQGHVDALSFCQFPKRWANLPSWVVDWDTQVRSPSVREPDFSRFRASGDSLSRQNVSHPQPGQLTLHGVAVDMVREYGDTWDPNWTQPLDHRAAIAFVRGIKHLCANSPRTRMQEEHVDALRIAICDGVSLEDTGMDDDMGGYLSMIAEGFEEFEAADDCKSKKKGQGGATECDSWFGGGMHRLHSRRPFITSTGFVGLCPSHADVGDVVCIFYGGKTPYVIRPTGIGTYSLIGEAYVHGIMYGEFLKGDPPSEAFTLV